MRQYNVACPACGSLNLEVMFDVGEQPMSLVSLMDDKLDSQELPRHRTRLAVCHNCMHVHNIDYNDNYVSYSQEGCRMYNAGAGWQEHVDSVRDQLEDNEYDFVVEVGAGDCEFLASLEFPNAVKLAVDPCEAVLNAEEYGIPYVRDYFDYGEHVPQDSGSTLIIMRHLLEHMTEPRDFIEKIVKGAEARREPTMLYIEVPCCYTALKNTRIEDWTYEHPQHFTLTSLSALLRACGVYKSSCVLSYDGEVITAFAVVNPVLPQGLQVKRVLESFRSARNSIDSLSTTIGIVPETVAFWGGAGKSAVFLNQLNLPSTAVVVDSHEDKQGMYVPGTGIKIQSPDVLRNGEPRTIVATTSWRAKDIAREIVEKDIPCKKLAILKNGYLVEVKLGE